MKPALSPSWVESLCRWLAPSIAFGVTAGRVPVSPQWRDDFAVVKSLGLEPLGLERVLGSQLAQAASLIPLGGRALRAAWVSSFGVALTAFVVYTWTRRLLDQNAETPRLSPVLALCAGLLGALTASWQVEGTSVGGTTLAAAFALTALHLSTGETKKDARVWFVQGALLGLVLVESLPAAIMTLVALGARIAVDRELPRRRWVLLFGLGACAATTICLLPWVLRPMGTSAWRSLGQGLATGASSSIFEDPPSSVGAWRDQLGMLGIVLAVIGMVWGVLRPRSRSTVVLFLVLVTADFLFPHKTHGELFPDRFVPLRLMALAVLGMAATLGAHTTVLALKTGGMPMAGTAGVLFLVMVASLVLATNENAGLVTRRRDRPAVEAWTDEALHALPSGSLLLARSPSIVWRLWAARIVRGERPDVLVVPLPLLGRMDIAQRLLEVEPRLAPLITETAMKGRPGEYTLSTLADARPLYVELDPRWDRRLFEQLLPTAMWLGFTPHALGRSDRLPALEQGREAWIRVLDLAGAELHPDPATLAVLLGRARERIVVLAALGDRQVLPPLLDEIARLAPRSAFASAVRSRLEQDPRGGIDVTGLLEIH